MAEFCAIKTEEFPFGRRGQLIAARFSPGISAVLLLIWTATPASLAQGDSTRLSAIDARMQQQVNTYNHFPTGLRQLMTGNANMAHVARMLKTLSPALVKALPRAVHPAAVNIDPQGARAIVPGVSRVSDPSTDLDISGLAGFTQSGTSTAWCGDHVVVGFNDSGSVLQTLVNGPGGLSFSGIALSTNSGATFKDLGPVPPGSNPSNYLGGDPELACSSPSKFYYAQLFATADSSGNSISSIALSTSDDGGQTWSDPRAVVNKPGTSHLIDKEALSVDPTNVQRLYIAYTDFDYSLTNPACPNTPRTAIEVVASKDGGATWGAPVAVDTVCGFSESVGGAHVVIGAAGQIDVAWLHFTNFPTGPRELRFTSYTRGTQPKEYSVIDHVVSGGDSIFLQGGFRDFLGLDLAIDRSGGPRSGELYVTWDDGRNKAVPDLAGMSGSYAFDDILLRISSDSGATWGLSPVRINSDRQPRVGYGHDHYQPGVAVDPSGKIGVCWYDRRADTSNFGIERYCATSTDAYVWTNMRVAIPSFGPEHDTDNLVVPSYMGDYDGVASDFTQSLPGFVGAFQVMNSKANPDVNAFRFQ